MSALAVIDYGAGNLRSVMNALEFIGGKPFLAEKPSDLKKCRAIILPGVGAFGEAISGLSKLGFIGALNEEVLAKKKPYLGICLGMHFLARESHEYGVHKGFGWIDGVVRKITPNDSSFRVPHVGWNDIKIKKKSVLFSSIKDPNPFFYFVHSYHFVADRGNSSVVTSFCRHGGKIVASVQKDNIFGVQFHPEKSQSNGLKVLKAFTDMAKEI